MPRPTSSLLDNFSPSGTGTRVTIDHVVMAAAGWLAYALVTAMVGYFTADAFASMVSPLVLLVGLVGLTFLDYRIYKAPKPPTALMAVSLGFYGYFVGAMSGIYSHVYDNGGLGLIASAAAGTVVTAAVVIGLYKAGIIKANDHKFRSMVIAAGAGYFIVVCASLLMQTFGGPSLFGDGPLGWVLCLFGTTIAALSLTLAAGDIDNAIAAGAPDYEASRLGWAFVSTLLWLYLEILRLIARARD
jgi:uncharacterized YccA/Bax inhibitor family protein